MTLKNKELKKLFDVVELYYDMVSLPSVMTSFMACEDEIAALKAELTDANRYKDFYRDSANNLRSAIFERGDELRKANNQIDGLKNDLKMAEARIEAQKKTLDEERKHSEDLADANCQLASENVDLKARLTLLENSRTGWRSRAQHAEKEVEDLNKKISELEEENANLRVTPADAIRIKSLERANKILRRENGTLWTTLEKRDIGERTCYESLSETIEFQNKKIEELEAEKARLKEAYDIQETTIKRLKLLLTQQNEIDALKKENSKLRTLKEDLSYDHEFEFGDKVYVPWSDEPYMYFSTSLLYNPRTERLVYVGKDQDLKWFGEKFAIV